MDLGEHAFDGAAAVVDGDTVRVRGVPSTLRLLGIDTEETFKRASERSAYAQGFDAYRKQQRGSSARPVKMATPLGEDAKHFAQQFFEKVSRVRIERDHPAEVRDAYGRYLAYVLVEAEPGRWLNYNVECVRAGMSPYFVKYGRSRRYHAQFLAAQAQAQKAHVGIWDPKREHYGDYEERLAWWAARDEAVTRFEGRMASHEDHIALTRADALEKLQARVGQAAVVFGAVSQVHVSQKGPTVVRLSRSRGNDFDLVFFDREVLQACGIAERVGEYVEARGVVSTWLDQRRGVERLQIIVKRADQVTAAGAPGATAESEGEPD